MNRKKFFINQVVIAKLQKGLYWPCILLSKSSPGLKPHWKIELFGTHIDKYIDKNQIFHFGSRTSKKKMKTPQLLRALEEAEKYKNECDNYLLIKKSNITVNVIENCNDMVDIHYDLNQKQDLNKLLVDIVRYLTNFAKKLLNFNNCKNKKGEQRKYVLDENEKEFMNIALIFLKTRFFSMDFIKTTHLGIIFSYILDNLDVADKDSCSLIKEIEELIDLMKKQCLEY